jgi:hypothetical protein
MSEQNTKSLTSLLEKFRERLDSLARDDVGKKTRRALADIDAALGLIERAIADFKVKIETIVGD